MSTLLNKVAEPLPDSIKASVRQFRERVVPVYRKYRYRLKLFFYSLPLLIHWIYPITFDRDENTLKTAKRSMMYFLFFIGATLLLYLIRHFFYDILRIRGDYAKLAFYLIQTLLTAMYAGVSLWNAVMSFGGKIYYPGFVEESYSIIEEKLSS